MTADIPFSFFELSCEESSVLESDVTVVGSVGVTGEVVEVEFEEVAAEEAIAEDVVVKKVLFSD